MGVVGLTGSAQSVCNRENSNWHCVRLKVDWCVDDRTQLRWMNVCSGTRIDRSTQRVVIVIGCRNVTSSYENDCSWLAVDDTFRWVQDSCQDQSNQSQTLFFNFADKKTVITLTVDRYLYTSDRCLRPHRSCPETTLLASMMTSMKPTR